MARVPAQDAALALAVAFLNTYDLLNDPPDQLSLGRLRAIADSHGQRKLAAALAEADLDALRAIRRRLYRVFATAAVDAKLAALNGVLADVATGARLAGDESGRFRLVATGGPDAVRRFAALVADALAHALATGGPERLGTCAGDPCRCVYVDRTRGGRQRYCCDLCNDRMSAAAYRRRSRLT